MVQYSRRLPTSYVGGAPGASRASERMSVCDESEAALSCSRGTTLRVRVMRSSRQRLAGCQRPFARAGRQRHQRRVTVPGRV